MPLAADVDLPEIAEHSHGFVGADLEALGQEVGMIALRRFLSSVPSIPTALQPRSWARCKSRATIFLPA